MFSFLFFFQKKKKRKRNYYWKQKSNEALDIVWYAGKFDGLSNYYKIVGSVINLI